MRGAERMRDVALKFERLAQSRGRDGFDSTTFNEKEKSLKDKDKGKDKNKDKNKDKKKKDKDIKKLI